jgi:predicted signal transduction protein with EAL and GGDEF domain
MRESDTLARLGGDEFVVILAALNGQESAAVAAQRLLDLFCRPFTLECRKVYSSATIGIALYPDDGLDVETLFKRADTAMYHAKTEGKANYRFFSAEMNERIMRRVALENCLRQGMEKGEFFLHYQPQWDLKSARMLGVEALLRWQSAELGALMPTEFIPLAENSGQIIGLGEWAMRSACIQAREWALAGYRDLRMGVNISGLQFRQPDFLEMVGKTIRETGIEPGALDLEFTESVVMEHADKNTDILKSLKEMGVHLSIDDFGTGYSSLSYLKHFPIDRIKIDRSFVADVNTNYDDAAIVEAIISMAHSLNLRVVAEGVENIDQLRFLETRNCDEVQGFHLAMPMSADDLARGMHCRSFRGEMGE